MSEWRSSGRLILIVAVALTMVSTDALLSREAQSTTRRIVVVNGREAIDGEVIVRYRAGANAIDRAKSELLTGSAASELLGYRARRLRSRNQSTEQMIAALRANPDVELVEPNYLIRASSVPNDPSLS